MVRKPGSWTKLNKLTKAVTVASRKKSFVIALCTILYVAALIPASYFAVQFLSSVLKTEGPDTNGDLPDFEEGYYYILDFSETPMRDNPVDQPSFKLNPMVDQNTGRKYYTASSTSLRLEYAYNDIFMNAGADYISINFVYKNKYPDPSKISVLNIYTDAEQKHPLSLYDVQKNNLNITNTFLYLKIAYDGKEENQLIMMPTIFVGTETFLSNFYKFKMGETINREITTSTTWERQSKILGMKGTNFFVQKASSELDLNDQVYQWYHQYYDNFWQQYYGEDSEFVGSYNPYSNFVISTIKANDNLLGSNVPISAVIDDRQYYFDLNALLDDKSINPSPPSKKVFKVGGDYKITSKYLPQLLVFLKNILVTKDHPNPYLPYKLLPEDWQDWAKLLPAEKLDLDNPANFYFMFLPEGETMDNLVNNELGPELVDVFAGKITLAELVKQIRDDFFNNVNTNNYTWLLKWNSLPFQTYDVVQRPDYQREKWRIQEDKNLTITIPSTNPNPPSSEFITIDRPAVQNVVNLGSSKIDPNQYLLSDPQKRLNFFTNFWDTSGTYDSTLKDNNVIKIQLNANLSEADVILNLKDDIYRKTYDFAASVDKYVGSKLAILDGLSYDQYSANMESEYTFDYQPIDTTHMLADKSKWLDSIANPSQNGEFYKNCTALDITFSRLNPTGPLAQNTFTFRLWLYYLS